MSWREQDNLETAKEYLGSPTSVIPSSALQLIMTEQDEVDYAPRVAPTAEDQENWKRALHALAAKEYEQVAQWCQRAETHPLAQSQLAELYLRGLGGLEKSSQRAFECYQKATGLGHYEAMLKVGQMYEDGVGTEVNYQKAASCYRRICRSEHDCSRETFAEALFGLGCLYMMGEGVNRDSSKAFLLWDKAADLGHENAQEFVALRELAS
jgi:TPR repeat protein